MAYPTPTIYYWRISQIVPGQGSTLSSIGNNPNGRFVIEFSQDGGVTYNPAFAQIFDTINAAYDQINYAVENEVQWQSQTVLAGRLPTTVHWPYPPVPNP